MRRELVALGHPVIEAGDGDEAREILDAVPGIGLLITDIVMPGAPTGARCAATPRAPAQPAHADDQRILGRAARPGERPWPLLRKPFTPEELRSTLEETLK